MTDPAQNDTTDNKPGEKPDSTAPTSQRQMPEWTAPYIEMQDEDGYVPFNQDRRLGQNQYASRYADGRHGYAHLGKGLAWNGDPSDYHDLTIHRDDLVEFHKRVEKHKKDQFAGRG